MSDNNLLKLIHSYLNEIKQYQTINLKPLYLSAWNTLFLQIYDTLSKKSHHKEDIYTYRYLSINFYNIDNSKLRELKNMLQTIDNNSNLLISCINIIEDNFDYQQCNDIDILIIYFYYIAYRLLVLTDGYDPRKINYLALSPFACSVPVLFTNLNWLLINDIVKYYSCHTYKRNDFKKIISLLDQFPQIINNY